MKFYIAELENENSYREASIIDAVSLQGAKVAAERRRIFKKTVLLIGDAVDGNGYISRRLSVKIGKKWHDLT